MKLTLLKTNSYRRRVRCGRPLKTWAASSQELRRQCRTPIEQCGGHGVQENAKSQNVHGPSSLPYFHSLFSSQFFEIIKCECSTAHVRGAVPCLHFLSRRTCMVRLRYCAARRRTALHGTARHRSAIGYARTTTRTTTHPV